MTSTTVTYCYTCYESWAYDTYDRGRDVREWHQYLNDVMLDHLLDNSTCMEMARLANAAAALDNIFTDPSTSTSTTKDVA